MALIKFSLLSLISTHFINGKFHSETESAFVSKYYGPSGVYHWFGSKVIGVNESNGQMALPFTGCLSLVLLNEAGYTNFLHTCFKQTHKYICTRFCRSVQMSLMTGQVGQG